jgi:hypothetical protein
MANQAERHHGFNECTTACLNVRVESGLSSLAMVFLSDQGRTTVGQMVQPRLTLGLLLGDRALALMDASHWVGLADFVMLQYNVYQGKGLLYGADHLHTANLAAQEGQNSNPKMALPQSFFID